MFELFKDVRVDWLKNRRIFIMLSTTIMLAGLASAMYRHAFHPNGTEAFNLGVDFKGGTVITAEFNRRPSAEEIRDRLAQVGVKDAVIQPVLDKSNQMLIKVPLTNTTELSAQAQNQSEVDPGASKVEQALASLGDEAGAKIVQREAVGPVAGQALRNQAVSVTLLALLGILAYIAFRFEWTYGAAAVIAVFHDVLVTLGFFSIFQWEISLTVIAALLTLVGFSVNDTIVVFDRIRENLRLHRRDPLYKVTNDSINQTLSRTIITSGLVFLSVLALVLFGGEVLRGFSLALLIGIVFGTYSSIAIASPIMVWWQERLDVSKTQGASGRTAGGGTRGRTPQAGAQKVRGAAAR